MLALFKKNERGQDPAWTRSLFEDTTEYGLGIAISARQRRGLLIDKVWKLLDLPSSEQAASPELAALLEKLWKIQDNPDAHKEIQF